MMMDRMGKTKSERGSWDNHNGKTKIKMEESRNEELHTYSLSFNINILSLECLVCKEIADTGSGATNKLQHNQMINVFFFVS